MQRSIRQGCPISSLLFIFATESLAQKLKEKLGGIKITRSGNHINIKIAQYADDTILFLSNFKDVLSAIELLNKYESVAGLKLNISKTEALFFAEDFDTVQEIHGIKCIIEGETKCLCIYIGHNMEACDEKGQTEKIRQIDKLLQIWKKRNLTTFGKITILKCLAIPKIIHIAQKAWKLVSNLLKIAINLSDIVFGHKLSCHENYIISFVTFCIFKLWILGNKITVNIHNFKIFLKHELLYKSNEKSEYI